MFNGMVPAEAGTRSPVPTSPHIVLITLVPGLLLADMTEELMDSSSSQLPSQIYKGLAKVKVSFMIAVQYLQAVAS